MRRCTTRPLSRYVLSRLLPPLAIMFAAYTAFEVVTNRHILELVQRRMPASFVLQVVLLSVPYTVAVTLPLSMFVAVLVAYTRLATDRALAAMEPRGIGLRRLVAPSLAAAACISVAAFVWNDQVVPRSNVQLSSLLPGEAPADGSLRSDRTMTMAELGRAADRAREEALSHPSDAAGALRRAAAYEVEWHKKLAISTMCLAFALFGAPLGLRYWRGGMQLVVGAAVAASAVLYVCLVAGESLANRGTVPPSLAMWTPDVAFGIVGATLLIRMRRWRLPVVPDAPLGDGRPAASAPDVVGAPAETSASPGRTASPTWLRDLYFRPRTFFTGLARDRIGARAVLAAVVVGVLAYAGWTLNPIFNPPDTLPRPTGLPWWPYLVQLLRAGVVAAVPAWFVYGWWYRVRLTWAGVPRPPSLEPRLLQTYSAFVMALPFLMYLIVAAFAFPGIRDAFSSNWTRVLLIFPYWSVLVSYRGLRTWYRPTRLWTARLLFVVLPCALYASSGTLLSLLYRALVAAEHAAGR